VTSDEDNPKEDNPKRELLEEISHILKLTESNWVITWDLWHQDWLDVFLDEKWMNVLTPAKEFYKKSPENYLWELFETGIELIISWVRIWDLSPDFLWCNYDEKMVSKLKSLWVDPTWEDWEFQTLVTRCSLYKQQVSIDCWSPTDVEYWRDGQGCQYTWIKNISWHLV